jgi:hypothetical protein
MPNWRENFEQLRIFISESWESIKFIFQTAADVIKLIWETVWSAISNFIGPKISFIKDTIDKAFTWIKTAFNTVSGPIKDVWSSIWDGVKDKTTSAWEGIKNVIKESINWIIDKINWFINAANSTALKGAGALGVSIPNISQIPRLAAGGIVTRPTIAMIGEAGPEAVIPLSRGGRGAGQMVTINFSNNTIVGAGGIREVARLVGDEIAGNLGMNMKLSY